LLALPMGILLSKIYDGTVSCFRCYLALVIVLGIGLNMFQSYQYHKAIIHWDSMNEAMYWQRFLKAKHPPEGFPPVN
jgi:heme/copper-type cytochrome/quinol oxidase subunit 3